MHQLQHVQRGDDSILFGHKRPQKSTAEGFILPLFNFRADASQFQMFGDILFIFWLYLKFLVLQFSAILSSAMVILTVDLQQRAGYHFNCKSTFSTMWRKSTMLLNKNNKNKINFNYFFVKGNRYLQFNAYFEAINS